MISAPPKGLFRGDELREYQEWIAQCQRIEQATGADLPDETAAEKEARIARLLKDPDAFCRYYLPQLKETPPYIIKAAKKVLEGKRCRRWWMMFRGARKSTWLLVIIPMMLKARGEMRFMLLPAHDKIMARRQLANIKAQLVSNHRYIADFGHQIGADSWEATEFTTADGCHFVGIGMEQQGRGLNKNLTRPDYIVASDLDNRELSKNPARCKEMYDWLMGDILNTFDTDSECARFIYDNNYWSKTSIGTHLLNNKAFTIDRVDALDSKGRPAAYFVTPEWIAEKKALGENTWQREQMNNPVGEGDVYKKRWEKWIKPLPLKQYAFLISYLDASMKGAATNDYKALSLAGYTNTGDIHILAAFCRQCENDELVAWDRRLEYRLRKEQVARVAFVEYNGYIFLLQEEYIKQAKGTDMFFCPLEDRRAKPNKFDRIEGNAVNWQLGRVYYSEELRGDPDFQAGLGQLDSFGHGSTAYNDFPDSLEGNMWIGQKTSAGRVDTAWVSGGTRRDPNKNKY